VLKKTKKEKRIIPFLDVIMYHESALNAGSACREKKINAKK
jgi:hypothetical protein